MKFKKYYSVVQTFALLLVFSLGGVQAQTWNPNHAIGTVTANYSFAYNQVPDQLVAIYPAELPLESGCTYQWQQSTSPVFSTYSNAAGVSTAASYSFSAALAQTTYFRRVTTNVALGAPVYSNIVKIAIVTTGWENINYIREHAIETTGITGWSAIDQLAIGQKLVVTNYLDGLGRPLQQVSNGTATPPSGSTAWGDIVQFSAYDAYGKQPLTYLPYSSTTTPGKYKTNAATEQPQYYTSVYNETTAYNTLTYDNSPLNRLVNIKESGAAWAGASGRSAAYDMNSAADNVQIFSVPYVRGNSPTSKGAYGANQLFRLTNTDENGKQVIEYINQSGQLVLKKIQLDATPSAAHAGWICTYSIYDDYGLLRYQIQPEGVKYLDANGWSFLGTNGLQVLNEWCYQYDYDEKGRVVWKKEPGAQPMQIVYDARNRVVFTQDGNQAVLATPQWTTQLYDALDRPVVSLLYNTTETTTALQNDINSTSGSSIQIAIGSANTVTVYNSPLSSATVNNTALSVVTKYQFYDDYSFQGAKAFNTGFSNLTAYSTTDPDVLAITPSGRTWSRSTGSMVNVLGTATYLYSTLYYDEKGHLIQANNDNILQGQDIVTFQYHFNGKQLSKDARHSTTGSGYTNFDVLSKRTYDKIWRISNIQKQFGASALKTVVAYDYDDIGRVKTKHLDPGYTGGGKTEMEALAYSYNLHNQLTGINKDYALKTGGVYNKWGSFFGMYLGYDNKDNVFSAANLDGHITGVLWNTQGDDAQRKYDFNYDNSGRLAAATFAQKQNTTDSWSNAAMDFSVTGLTYDYNGNVLSMLQNGVVPGNSTPVQIDNLAYTYAQYSNKLVAVKDNTAQTATNGQSGDFKDGVNTGNDYSYDNNGNLTTDLNKGIGSSGAGISYNFLDKPVLVNSAAGTVRYVYDGSGQKLQKIFTPAGGGAAVTTSYINEYVYQGSTLQYINFEEGRVRVIQPVAQNNGYDVLSVAGNLTLPNSTQGVFDFFVRDYQGNTRMVLTEEIHTGTNQCTMESSRQTTEDAIFQGTGNEVENSRAAITVIPGQSSGGGWHSNTSASVSQLGNYSGGFKTGPNTLLKVMAGDVINATTQYYYQAPVSNATGSAGLTQSVISSLIGAISGGTAVTGLVHGNTTGIANLLGASTNAPFITATEPDVNNAAGTNPKAYLTILFFDERFNFVATGSTSQRVTQAGDNASPLVLAGVQAPKNGYAFVYVSNETAQPVYFDNMQVGLNHGRIIEEDHYYAFGLKIAGLSSNGLADSHDGYFGNKNLYNDHMLDDDMALNWYDYGYRQYDAQTGRFLQTDPLVDVLPFLSPYHYAYNDPITHSDFSGLLGIDCPGTPAIKIFFEKLGETIGNIGRAIPPTEHVLSISAHVVSEAVVIGNVVSTNNIINKMAIVQVGSTNVLAAGGSKDPAQNILIARSKTNELNGEDGTFGTNGDLDWGKDKTEPELEDMMRDLINYTTDQNAKMRDVALHMTQRFFDNTGGNFSDPDLDETVDHDENFRGFANNVFVRFNEELKKAGGDINKFKTFTVGNPAFNRSVNRSDGLGITIHGVSYVEVHLLKFKVNPKSSTYRVELQFDLYDNFGLDSPDINDGHWWNPSSWYHYNNKLKAWWLLQHKFGHRPLRTHVQINLGADLNPNANYGKK